jgi:hypothetical protein
MENNNLKDLNSLNKNYLYFIKNGKLDFSKYDYNPILNSCFLKINEIYLDKIHHNHIIIYNESVYEINLLKENSNYINLNLDTFYENIKRYLSKVF